MKNKQELDLTKLKEYLNSLIIEREKRKDKNKLLNYNTGEKVHKKQMIFHKCDKKNRWVFGGNRTGKTECGAVETIWLARGNHPYKQNRKNINCWVVSLSSQVQRDVAQAKILHYINPDWIEDVIMTSGKKDSYENGIIDRLLIKNVFGGISTIGFKNCDQGREKFQGTSLDFVWFDEEPPFDIYQECKMRVIDRCGYIFGTMTPLKGLSWVYNEIYLNEKNDPDVWYEQISWKDNPFLNENEIQKIMSSMTKEELDSRCDGKFVGNSGLVYPNFSEEVNVIDPFDVPKDWFDMISIDPGYTNPLSCHWYAVDNDDNVFVIAEHYEKEKDLDYHAKKIHEISKKLNWKTQNGKLYALIDSASLQKTLASQKSVADLFYEQNICVNTKVDKDVFSGIQKVRMYIKDANNKSKLFIFRSCVNMIREIKGYRWNNDESPIKKDDHAMDELRYYIASRTHKYKKENKSEIQRDKEKLIKQLKCKSIKY